MISFAGHKSQHIAYADNLIPSEDCDALLEECRLNYGKLFAPGPTISGVNTSIKSSMDFNFSPESCRESGVGSSVFDLTYSSIRDGLQSAMSLYIEAYPELHHSEGLYDSGFRLQHYQKNGGHYRRHHDGAPWDQDPFNRRVIAVIIYLNDVSRGGGTTFLEHGITVDAVKGRIALFPSTWTHPHSGCVPVSGDKWIISTFIHCYRRGENIVTPTQMSEEEIAKIVDMV
jgi:hypothetical protein